SLHPSVLGTGLAAGESVTSSAACLSPSSVVPRPALRASADGPSVAPVVAVPCQPQTESQRPPRRGPRAPRLAAAQPPRPVVLGPRRAARAPAPRRHLRRAGPRRDHGRDAGRLMNNAAEQGEAPFSAATYPQQRKILCSSVFV